jgi:hypothetical protein
MKPMPYLYDSAGRAAFRVPGWRLRYATAPSATKAYSFASGEINIL